jgi:hypothetical protein
VGQDRLDRKQLVRRAEPISSAQIKKIAATPKLKTQITPRNAKTPAGTSAVVVPPRTAAGAGVSPREAKPAAPSTRVSACRFRVVI